MNKRILACATVAAALAACGGGGGGGSSSGGNNNGGGGNPPPAAVVKISGTAVRGAALANVTVQVKCGAGTGSAVTDATGKFTVSITDGSLPCVLQAPLPDGGFLHSAVAGTGTGDVSANISPLTELVVASAAGVDPATLFADFANRVAAVTQAALTSGTQQVVTQLAGTIDLAGANPLTDVMVIGQGLDAKIDTLNAALAEAGSTLENLTQAAIAASPAQPAPNATDYDAGTSGTASVAAEVLLKAPAPNCSALRSGDYRVVVFKPGADTTGKITINAETLVITNDDGTTDPLTPVGTCRYRTVSNGEVIVTAAGVLVFRDADPAQVFSAGLAFPEQAHNLSELAGPWNWIGQELPATATVRAFAGDITFDAAGKATAAHRCNDLKTCADATSEFALTLTANVGGGWDIADGPNAAVGRLFQFKAGGGSSMLVAKFNSGAYLVMTRPRTSGLPTAGTLGRTWNLGVNNLLQAPGAIGESGNVIDTVDDATKSYVRKSYVGTAGATVPETLHANLPRNGYTTRDANATNTATDGSTINTREFVFLGLRGMGFTPVAFGFNNSMTFSVGVPGIAWVAPEMINRPGAINCVALRSGDYRLLLADAVGAGQSNTILLNINATTLVATNKGDGSTDTLVPSGPCSYTLANGSEAVVSQAGVLFSRGGGNSHLRVGFPEQTHVVSELAGTWNKLGLQSPDTAGGPYYPDAATVTLDAQGGATEALYCIDVTTCQTITGLQFAHTVNPAGGFDRVTAVGNLPDRVFAFRAGSGDLMMVNLGSAGDMGFWTQKRSNGLPAVGTRTNTWDVLTGADLVTSVGINANVIASADTAANSVVRNRRTAKGALYTETVTINDPREGYNHRASGTTTASDGSTVTIREFTSLSMRGMGFSPLKYVGGPVPSFLLSVTQP